MNRLQRNWVMAMAMAGVMLFHSPAVFAGGVGQHDVARVEAAKAGVADLVDTKTNGPAEVTTGFVSIAPGGHTPWHYHPGPHLVMVKSGTVRVYETDCTFKTYAAGQGFYDAGPTDRPHIHTAYNAEAAGDAVLAITDIRNDDKRLTIAADPRPGSCFASTANGIGNLGVTRTEDAKGTVADGVAVATKTATEAVLGHISIGPGGHTAWHHHPGPHLVVVKSGTVRVYETDCTFKTYAAGQGFYDPGATDHPHIHAAYNPQATGEAVLAVTDLRETDKRLAIATEPQPASCFAAAGAAAAPALPASASEATGSATLPRTGAGGPPLALAVLGLGLVAVGAAARLLLGGSGRRPSLG
ncbi:MAG: cupin domain-containing protein [Actinomycetota bacterium]|jgi:quercetin dioxygenase-like cupin family protein